MVSPEAAPLSRVGGLGDFVRGLVVALARAGHDVRVMVPAYGGTPLEGTLVHDLDVPYRNRVIPTHVIERTFPGTERPAYQLAHHGFSDRPGIYGDGPRDYPDNPIRYGFFCRAALAWLLRLGWQPDIVHAHDWPAAAAIVHLRTTCYQHPFFAPVAGIFTFQDLQFQGIFDGEAMEEADLPADAWHSDALEAYGMVNLLKGGVAFADFMTTVSQAYAGEIQREPDLGLGLEHLFAQRHNDLVGILKGVDDEAFDPSSDREIGAPFDVSNLAGKKACREALLREFKLAPSPQGPVIGVLTRCTVRRGIPILLQVLPRLLAEDVRVVMCGQGDPKLESDFKMLAARHPDKLSVTGYPDIHLVHRLYAGSDVLLRPSLHEPCAVPPMEGLRYGALVVGRRVGGMVDSMVEESEGGYAFLYAHPGPESLEGALQRMMACWASPERWQAAMKRAMACNFSWDRVAEQYAEVYERAISRREPAVLPRRAAWGG
jgi:starch synthase